VLNNFRNLQSLLWSQGSRWLMFRLGYALRKRTGLLRAQIPAYEWRDRPLEMWLRPGVPAQPEAYTYWRRQNSPEFFFEKTAMPDGVPWNSQIAVDEAERILLGELKYFAHKFITTGFPPDWHRDPISGIKLDVRKHWSELSDDRDVDIKFIWEPSRFSMVYTLVRAYAVARDEKYAGAFWALIESWTESNPPNRGPNWMDGQEAALRLMAWTFGYHAFLGSPSTTPERIAQFTVLVAAHAERIYENIGYAISTRGNHTISEGFGLWLTGLLFPELKHAATYRKLGQKLLEQQAVEQIFPDGSYSMYSLNYHRFVLHIYLYALRLAEINQSSFSRLIYERVSACIEFLTQLIEPETGQMPVYGSNDGALVLPLNNCDFTDYRPLLQLGSYVTKKSFLFEPGHWDEDIFWLCGADSLSQREIAQHPVREVRVREKLNSSFPYGGLYLLHGQNSKVAIRCTDYRARPSHADQLHVELWWRGQNIACDAGTFVYSGEGLWRNGLARTSAHNTVTVDHQDQMKMLTRFTWTDWATGKVLRHDREIWQGEHDGYSRLPDPVHHRRTVLSLGEDRWLVVDHLTGRQRHHYALHWLLDDVPYEQAGQSVLLSLDPGKYQVQVGLMAGDSTLAIVHADPNSTRGWRSRYYGEKEPAISVILETDRPSACFWTFFGFESDAVEASGNVLYVSSRDTSAEINLDDLSRYVAPSRDPI
jgi:asparagine synthase (glutamine-hydrolysing)